MPKIKFVDGEAARRRVTITRLNESGQAGCVTRVQVRRFEVVRSCFADYQKEKTRQKAGF
jgi:hypothetical protein